MAIRLGVPNYPGDTMILTGTVAKKDGGVGLKTTGHTLRKFKPNIQKVRAVVDGVAKRVRLCTRCLKSGAITKKVRAPQAS